MNLTKLLKNADVRLAAQDGETSRGRWWIAVQAIDSKVSSYPDVKHGWSLDHLSWG